MALTRLHVFQRNLSKMLPSVTTSTSVSLAQARNRSLALYREWMRAAPEICNLYHLEINSRVVQQRIRQEFEKNRFVRDLSVVDILLFKGRIELEETLNLFKQPTHVMRFFADPFLEPKPKDFLSKFYNGN